MGWGLFEVKDKRERERVGVRVGRRVRIGVRTRVR
jgi:hypothetical protein